MSPFSMQFHLFTLLLHFFYYTNGVDDCVSCASPILGSEWQATGFPMHPPRSTEVITPPAAGTNVKSFAFTDNCDKKYDATTNKLPITSCQGGVCIEMLLIANGIYATVRGCLADFFPSSKPPTYGKEQCIVNTLQHQNTTIWEGDKPVPIQQTFVGFSTCKSQSDIPCNINLEANSKFASGTFKKAPTDNGWNELCERAGGGVQCLECQRYDMEGTCNWDVRKYCQGGWCTKTIGYVNGRWLEVRGCAPINPLNSQSCVKIEKTTQFPLLADMNIPRTISIEHCMCNGQKCNGAMKMTSKMIPIELLLILAISIMALNQF